MCSALHRRYEKIVEIVMPEPVSGILTDLDISLYPPIEEDTTIGSFLAIFFRSVSLINRLLKNPSESFDMLRTNGNAY